MTTTTPAERDIERCPFCGSSASMQTHFGVDHWVQCDNLQCASSNGKTTTDPRHALATWNRRAAQATAEPVKRPRLIPDAECVQSKCGCTTTGCWDECSLRRNPVIFAAPDRAPSTESAAMAMLKRVYEGEYEFGICPTQDEIKAVIEGTDSAADARDAARYRWLRDSKFNALYVNRNSDTSVNYRTAKQWIEEDCPDWFTECAPEDVQAMKDSDTIWHVQIYPDTPISSYSWYGATLDSSIDAAIAAMQDQ